MQPTDRDLFEVRMGVLCAGFNVPATAERIEAYWTGLQHMPLSTFIRLAEASLGEHGAEKLPTVSALWALHRQSKAVRMDTKGPADKTRDPAHDAMTSFGQRALLRFTGDPKRSRQPSAVSLAAMVEAKNKLVASYRSILTEEEVDSAEMLDVFLNRFEELYEPAPDSEIQFIRDGYLRTSRALPVPVPGMEEAA